MKRVLQHPPESRSGHETGRNYWRSVQEYADTPDFQEWLSREFPPGAAEFEAGGVSRRSFLQLMGASMALAGFGLSGCHRRPETHIVPYTQNVEWIIPGRPLYYATAMPRAAGSYFPLVASTHEGRPTHLDGNKLVPGFNGGSDAITQASVLDLYDPDRAWSFFQTNTWKSEGGKRSFETRDVERAVFDEYFNETIQALLNEQGGEGVALLLEPNDSPTRERLLTELREKNPNLLIAEHSPLIDHSREVVETAAGDGVRMLPDYSKAKVIVSLDHDFLGIDAGAEAEAQFAQGRRVDDQSLEMNRLYVAEGRLTVTGGMADHRLRVAPGQIIRVAASLARAVGAAAPGVPESGDPKFDEWAKAVATDLERHPGESLVMAGPRQPKAVHAMALAINEALGNFDKTISFIQTDFKKRQTLADLREEIEAEKIKALFVIGGNPAQNLPGDIDWGALCDKVGDVIRVGYHFDETSEMAQWHVPLAHYLESWGDGHTIFGGYVPVQPMLEPLNSGVSETEFLALLNGATPDEAHGFRPVRQTFEKITGKSGREADDAWVAFLRDGFLQDAPAPQTVSASASAVFTGLEMDVPEAPTGPDKLEISIVPDYKVLDGRYANNGWLQELPDPISKLTWDNCAYLSPKTAENLGLKLPDFNNWDALVKGRAKGNADLIEIEADGRKLQIAAHILPGCADNVLIIPMGYGRKFRGHVAYDPGFNPLPLMTTASGPILSGATARVIEASAYQLAFAQMYNYMEGRALVREGTMDEFTHDRKFAKGLGMDSHIPPNVSLYKTPPYEELSIHQWGMTIDLNTCTGCNACVIACQSENNIPIVGKIQVIRGREMHWIRLDRYFATPNRDRPLEDEEPQMIVQPLACVHCENAPCETVCPVNATIHSEDGLNVMAYNRCIGTRYCANNCPYKARRFNFFDYNDKPKGRVVMKDEEAGLAAQATLMDERDKLEFAPFHRKGMPESLKLSKNPNVTVRMRGVMEKCTYCVQRIQVAKMDQKIKAKNSANLKIPTDTVRTACQDACPSESIVFGDIADPAATVVKRKKEGRNYRLIEYLNTEARTSYLARIRNPNPEMPDYAAMYPEGHSHGHALHMTKSRLSIEENAHAAQERYKDKGDGKEYDKAKEGEAAPEHAEAGYLDGDNHGKAGGTILAKFEHP